MILRSCINRELADAYLMPVRAYDADGNYAGQDVTYVKHTMTRNCRHEHRATDPTCGECK